MIENNESSGNAPEINHLSYVENNGMVQLEIDTNLIPAVDTSLSIMNIASPTKGHSVSYEPINETDGQKSIIHISKQSGSTLYLNDFLTNGLIPLVVNKYLEYVQTGLSKEEVQEKLKQEFNKDLVRREIGEYYSANKEYYLQVELEEAKRNKGWRQG